MHWRHNLFHVPTGQVGALFVQEITSLLNAYSHATSLECVALKAAMILSSIMLQRPHPKSKYKDLIAWLKDRLAKWKEGDIDSLLHECL